MDEHQTLTLTPRQKHRAALFLAILLVFVAVGLAAFTFLFLGIERERLDALTPLAPAELQSLALGQKVLFTGTISPENPLLVRDLVVGCEEENYDDSWRSRREFNQPLKVSHGGVAVSVTLRQPCPRGRFQTIQHPTVKMRRWVGFPRGATLTVVGVVTGTEPLRVQADNTFGGDPNAYRSYLMRTRWYVLPVSGFLLLVAGLIWFGARRR